MNSVIKYGSLEEECRKAMLGVCIFPVSVRSIYERKAEMENLGQSKHR